MAEPTPPAAPQPLPTLAVDGAEATVVEVALALAAEMAPLLAAEDAGERCLAALRAVADAEGRTCTMFRGGGARSLWLEPDGRTLPQRRGGKGIGLHALLRPAPLGQRAVTPSAALLPSGLWSACLSLAAALHASGRDRLRLWIEVEDPAAPRAAAAEAAACLAGVHLWLSGDGGVPYHDGDQRVLPLTVGQRGAVWLEVRAGDGAAADLDREAPVTADAATALLDGLRALSAATPSAAVGPLFRATVEARLRGASPAQRAWLEALLDTTARPAALLQAPAGPRSYLEGLLQADWVSTRVDIGERPDRRPAAARAVLDLRVPADADLDAAIGALRATWGEAVPALQLRELARRPPLLAPLDHPLRAVLTAIAQRAGLPLAVVPEQARRDQRGAPWQQVDRPVIGFAPAWVGDDVDAASALRSGALQVGEPGLRFGAALFAEALAALTGAEHVAPTLSEASRLRSGGRGDRRMVRDATRDQ